MFKFGAFSLATVSLVSAFVFPQVQVADSPTSPTVEAVVVSTSGFGDMP